MALAIVTSIISTLLGFFGAILFAVGVMRMTPGTIAQLSIAYFGHNETQRKNLISQKCDFICGMILFALAFLVQFVRFFFKNNPGVFTDYYHGLIFGCILAIVIFLIILRLRINMMSGAEKRQKIAFARLNLRDELDFLKTEDKVKPGGVTDRIVGYKTLEEDAGKLCNFKRKPGETNEEFFRRYAKFLKEDIPVGVDLNNLH